MTEVFENLIRVQKIKETSYGHKQDLWSFDSHRKFGVLPK